MRHVQIAKCPHLPSRIEQPQRQVILLRLHEKIVRQPTDLLDRRLPQTHSASNAHIRIRAAFPRSCRQRDGKCRRAQPRMILEVANHPIDRAELWERVIVEENDVLACA